MRICVSPYLSLLRLIFLYERPPELLLVFDKGLGLRRCHDRYRCAELNKALLDARRLKRLTKPLVQTMHNRRGRSCWSCETHEADRTESRHRRGNGRHFGKKRIPFGRHRTNELQVAGLERTAQCSSGINRRMHAAAHDIRDGGRCATLIVWYDGNRDVSHLCQYQSGEMRQGTDAKCANDDFERL